MDKYNSDSDIPKRSDKNKELYRQIYNAYDDFENLVVPSNVKEIDLSNLKKEITSRDDYKKIKDYSEITNNKVVRKEIIIEEQKKENEIYDINELLNKVVKDKKDEFRKQNDFKAVKELTDNLKHYCPEDPTKYDFALFGFGIDNPKKNLQNT